MSAVARRPLPAVALRVRDERVLLAVLLLAAAAISAFTIHRRLDPYDEGLMLSAARRIGEGQWPYSEFAWPYGPAHPLLLAGLAKAFGPSVLWWRIVRVATDAGIAALAYVLARREAPVPLALVAWLAAATAMAQPASANPFPQALLLALGALLLATRAQPGRLALPAAGALAALAAWWRPDFGVLAIAAGTIAVAAGADTGRRRRVAVFVGTAVAGFLVLYAPFAIQAGPGTLWDRIVATSVRDGAWWTLPFPLSYGGGVGSLRDVKHLLDHYVPLLLLAGLALALVASAVRGRDAVRRRAGLLAFGLGAAWYLHSRADEFHTQPLIVVLAVLLAVAVADRGRPRVLPVAVADRGRPRVLPVACGVVLALLTLAGTWNRASALLRPPQLERVGLAVTDGVEEPAADARALRALVPYVQARVPPGRPIYVAPRRSDLVAFEDPLLYVLVDRDDPVPADAPLLSRRGEQLEAIAALERARPRIVIRWVDPLSTRPEPNLRGRSTGVRLLDGYLARAYRPVARFGAYLVLGRRRAA